MSDIIIFSPNCCCYKMLLLYFFCFHFLLILLVILISFSFSFRSHGYNFFGNRNKNRMERRWGIYSRLIEFDDRMYSRIARFITLYVLFICLVVIKLGGFKSYSLRECNRTQKNERIHENRSRSTTLLRRLANYVGNIFQENILQGPTQLNIITVVQISHVMLTFLLVLTFPKHHLCFVSKRFYTKR